MCYFLCTILSLIFSTAFEKAKLKREKADALEAKKKEKEDKEKKREELKKIVEEERLKKKEEKRTLLTCCFVNMKLQCGQTWQWQPLRVHCKQLCSPEASLPFKMSVESCFCSTKVNCLKKNAFVTYIWF